MRIIAIEREHPGVTIEKFQPHLPAEAKRIYELYQQDLIRECYFRADGPEAVLVMECESVDNAREALDTLPLVKAGLVKFELIPLRPYPGFSRLFSDEYNE